MSTQLIKPNYLVILPPTQHHSFFRNLPRSVIEVLHDSHVGWQKTIDSFSVWEKSFALICKIFSLFLPSNMAAVQNPYCPVIVR